MKLYSKNIIIIIIIIIIINYLLKEGNSNINIQLYTNMVINQQYLKNLSYKAIHVNGNKIHQCTL